MMIVREGKNTNVSRKASLIFLHGLGDTGAGWESIASMLIQHVGESVHLRCIFPTAPTIPVTLNMGMRMPAWYDIRGLDAKSREDMEGLQSSTETIASIATKEASEERRVILGGFSQGAALSLFATYVSQSIHPFGVIALSGYLPGRESIQRVPSIPLFFGYGDADMVVQPTWSKQSASFLRIRDVDVEEKVYKGLGHGACDEELKDVCDRVRDWCLRE